MQKSIIKIFTVDKRATNPVFIVLGLKGLTWTHHPNILEANFPIFSFNTSRHFTYYYIKQINNKDLLYSTGNYAQYFAITYKGKDYIHIWIIVLYTWN